MKTTVPTYTIFTCDSCGREQDDRKYQENMGTGSWDTSASALVIHSLSYTSDFDSRQVEMEVCNDCSVLIHHAIQKAVSDAKSEAIQEQLRIVEILEERRKG